MLHLASALLALAPLKQVSRTYFVKADWCSLRKPGSWYTMTWVGLGSGVAEGIYSQHRASWLFPRREGGSQHGRLVVAHSKFVIPRNDLAIWSYILCSVNTTATLRWRINSTL